MKINTFYEGLFQAVSTGCRVPLNECIVPFKSTSNQYTAPLQRAARKETLLIKLVRGDKERQALYKPISTESSCIVSFRISFYSKNVSFASVECRLFFQVIYKKQCRLPHINNLPDIFGSMFNIIVVLKHF
jgi:hypothetical protein